MEYELINPSDPYTFVADDFETAALVVLAISTHYGAVAKDDSENVPMFIFGGSEEWYTEQFGRGTADGLEAKKEQVATALSSMMLGSFEDRRRYEAALAAITDPNKKAEFISKWQNEYTSTRNIGGYCHRLAKKMKSEGGK